MCPLLLVSFSDIFTLCNLFIWFLSSQISPIIHFVYLSNFLFIVTMFQLSILCLTPKKNLPVIVVHDFVSSMKNSADINNNIDNDNDNNDIDNNDIDNDNNDNNDIDNDNNDNNDIDNDNNDIDNDNNDIDNDNNYNDIDDDNGDNGGNNGDNGGNGDNGDNGGNNGDNGGNNGDNGDFYLRLFRRYFGGLLVYMLNRNNFSTNWDRLSQIESDREWLDEVVKLASRELLISYQAWWAQFTLRNFGISLGSVYMIMLYKDRVRALDSNVFLRNNRLFLFYRWVFFNSIWNVGSSAGLYTNKAEKRLRTFKKIMKFFKKFR